MNDRRDQQLHFRVSKVELERIRQKMESCGILSIGSYLRKMALDSQQTNFCRRIKSSLYTRIYTVYNNAQVSCWDYFLSQSSPLCDRIIQLNFTADYTDGQEKAI